MSIIISLVLAVLMGLSVAALVVAIVLEKTISFGDSKGDFSTFSKFPVRMLSQSSQIH